MTQINEAIVLVGGKGTRLQGRVFDKPKPMAPICSRPFLEYLLKFIEQQGICHVVLSVGYMQEVILSHFGSAWGSLSLTYCKEEFPLGTGGAIREALKCVTSEHSFILNGDSILDIHFQSFQSMHQKKQADLTIALKKIDVPDRYGTVLQKDSKIIGFEEKGKCIGPALINGGMYLARVSAIQSILGSSSFSFETQTLPLAVKELNVFGIETDGFFIDIGVIEDFERAQFEPYLKELFKVT